MGFVEAGRVCACRMALLMVVALPAAMVHGKQQAVPGTVAVAARAVPATDDFGFPRAHGEQVSPPKRTSNAFSGGFEHARRTPAARLPKRPANPLASPPTLQSGPVFKGGGIR